MPEWLPQRADSWLRVFLAVAACGSLSGASARTELSQPAISQQVRQLEAWLGVKLFVRHGRGVRLTEAGLRLRERLVPALEAVDAAVLDCSTGFRSGTLRMASVHTINAYLLPEVIADFSRRRPDAETRVLCRGSAEVVELVEDGRVDLGLVYDSMVASAKVEIWPLLEERMVLCCARGTSFALSEFSGLFDGSLRLVSFPRGFALRQLLESHYGSAMNIVAEVETVDAMLRFVNAGVGAAILPDLLSAEAVGAPSVERVALPEPVPARRVVAIMRRDRGENPLLAELLDLVNEHAERLPGTRSRK